MDYRLGKTNARKGAVSFLFKDFFNLDKLPTPPATFGHYQGVKNFFMLANDSAGCCVWSGAAHEHMVWSLEGGRSRDKFTPYDVLSDYTAVTGFDPKQTDAQGNNPTDNGTDMSEAAAYRKKTGVLDANGARHKIDAYVALEVGNLDQLVLMTWLMGASGVGLQLPKSAITQFDTKKPWSVPWYNRKPKMAGGHYVPAVGRDIYGDIVFVTWGGTIPAKRGFYERFSDEAIAYLSLEILDEKGLSPEGYDADALRKHLGSLK